ncbi:MAG TPA: fructosamine kinase family protein [Thermoanaerobaculia bacterium]|nr:fructosamine kinase family protein [Thermoanaerobaculia bacterium]
MDDALRAAVAAALTAVGEPDCVGFAARGRSGGLHRTWLVSTASGRRWFVKSSPAAPRDQFPAEAHGLELLAGAGALRVPRPAIAGGPPPFLLMEAIATGRPGPGFAETLGRGLAELHRRTGAGPSGERSGGAYGLDRDNYLGTSPQPNGWSRDWPGFVRQRRLGPQLARAREAGRSDPELDRLGDRVLKRLAALLAGPDEPACLLHGDLWSGNVLADGAGAPVLIDPACWYGRREAELGMMLLFGGFSQRCWDAYAEAWPLEEGWRRRSEVFVAYHLLNHLNLFGRGYRQACVESLERLARAA